MRETVYDFVIRATMFAVTVGIKGRYGGCLVTIAPDTRKMNMMQEAHGSDVICVDEVVDRRCRSKLVRNPVAKTGHKSTM